MADKKQHRILLDPDHIEDSLLLLALTYDLDGDTLQLIQRILSLYSRPIYVRVDDTVDFLFAGRGALADLFTFDMVTDELVLYSADPETFINGLIEMAMYISGFTTMMGVDDLWKTEFAIGAWKPVRNSIKHGLGIPVSEEPRWIVGLPPEAGEAPPDDPHPFRSLVSRLDIASFTQMVRLAGREDVEVSFPNGTDPRVIQVYIRMKTAMNQVADGLGLADWREFNRRLLLTVLDLEQEYTPHRLPVPDWWRTGEKRTGPAYSPPDEPSLDEESPPGPQKPPPQGDWNPFEEYIEQLFNEEDTDNQGQR